MLAAVDVPRPSRRPAGPPGASSVSRLAESCRGRRPLLRLAKSYSTDSRLGDVPRGPPAVDNGTGEGGHRVSRRRTVESEALDVLCSPSASIASDTAGVPSSGPQEHRAI